MKLISFEDLFIDQLRDLYNAEDQILKIFPMMVKTAHSEELQEAFRDHHEHTKQHIERLEEIFEKLNVSAWGKRCKAMEGILEEGKETMHEEADPDVLDAALIAMAQRMEHYEIAGYGCARTFAQHLGDDQAANLLQETLTEEEESDRRLTQIAETSINVLAASHHG